MRYPGVHIERNSNYNYSATTNLGCSTVSSIVTKVRLTEVARSIPNVGSCALSLMLSADKNSDIGQLFSLFFDHIAGHKYLPLSKVCVRQTFLVPGHYFFRFRGRALDSMAFEPVTSLSSVLRGWNCFGILARRKGSTVSFHESWLGNTETEILLKGNKINKQIWSLFLRQMLKNSMLLDLPLHTMKYMES